MNDIKDGSELTITELLRRYQNQKDHYRQFAVCLDEIPEIQSIPGSGTEGNRESCHIRKIVKTLLNKLREYSRLISEGAEKETPIKPEKPVVIVGWPTIALLAQGKTLYLNDVVLAPDDLLGNTACDIEDGAYRHLES